MKLLKAIEEIRCNDKDIIEDIKICLEDRLEWLEDREPEYSGEVYDMWEDKCNDLQEILDLFEDYDDEEDMDEKANIIKDICSQIKDYQYMYGGLSRLTI